jgi:hypothetical protein
MTPTNVLDAADALGAVFAPVSPTAAAGAALLGALTRLGRTLIETSDDPVAEAERLALAAEKAAFDAKFGPAGS